MCAAAGAKESFTPLHPESPGLQIGDELQIKNSSLEKPRLLGWGVTGFTQIAALIHISSTVSDGRYNLKDIASIAEKSGFRAVVFTDREVMRWQYGIRPLRNILKKTVENNSIARFGVQRYLDAVAQLQNSYPDMVFLPGMESTPFYYWSGSVFKRNFTLHNAHKHMLIIGLDNAADIKRLPITATPASLYNPFSSKDAWRLWPLLVIGLGIFIIMREHRPLSFRNSFERLAFYQKRRMGFACIIIGALFFVNNIPFRSSRFDQYHGDKGTLPYQNFIDDVNAKGGMTFWAHPEIENSSQSNHIKVITKEHPEDFYNTHDYTGFSIFYEGYRTIGVPGGLWDKVLREYCMGKRVAAVWALGGLGFDYYGDLESRLADLRNILLVTEVSRKGVLDALKNGRVYVLRGSDSSRFVLESFTLSAADKTGQCTMGETLSADNGVVMVEISGHFKDDNTRKNRNVSVRLIKNGEVVQTFKRETPFVIKYFDNDTGGEGKAYYRVEITGSGLHAVSNPVFVMKNSY